MKHEFKKKTVLKAIAIFLAIMSFIGVFVLCNYFQEACYPLRLNTTVVVNGGTDGKTSALVDDQNSRLIFFNENYEVEKVRTDVNHMMAVNNYMNVCIYGDDAYVHDCSAYETTPYIYQETIKKYDKYGNYISTIVDIEYESVTTGVFPSQILDFDIEDDVGYILYFDRGANTTCLLAFDASEDAPTQTMQDLKLLYHHGNPIDDNTKIYGGALSARYDKWALVDINGNAYEGTWQDITPHKKTFSNTTFVTKLTYNFNGELCDDSFDQYCFLSVPFSPMLSLKVCLFWLSCAYLIMFTIVLIILYFRKLIKNNKITKIRNISVTLIVIFSIVGISAFYSLNILYDKYLLKSEMLEIQLSNTCNENDQLINDVLKSFNHGKLDTQKAYVLKNKLNETVNNYAKSNNNLFFSLYGVYDNKLYMVTTSLDYFQSGAPFLLVYDQDKQDELLSHDGDLFILEGLSHNFLDVTHKYYDDNGNLLGLISCETYFDLFFSQNMLSVIGVSLVLFTFIAFVFFLAYEISQFIKNWARRRIAIQKKQKNHEFYLIRPLMFLVSFIHELDSALMVLIAKDLLTGTSEADNGFLLGMPAVVHSLGITIGLIVMVLIFNKVCTRNLGIVSIFTVIVSYVFCGWAISIGDFWLYIIFKFISVICLGVAWGIPNTLLMLAKSEKSMAKMSVGLIVTILSAGVLATLLSGYLAEYINDALIYYLAIIPGVLLLAIYVFMFRRKVSLFAENRSKSKNSISEITKFMFSKNMLIYMIFIIAITTITFAYRTYIFPLLGNGYGWDKAMISSLIVISNVVIFACMGWAKTLEKKFDYWMITIICMAGTCITFAVLYLNIYFIWPVIALVCVGFFNQLINSYLSVVAARECKDKNVDSASVNIVILVIRNLFAAIKTPIAAGLFMVSANFSFIVFSAISAIGGAVYSVTTKRSAMNSKVSETTDTVVDDSDEELDISIEELSPHDKAHVKHNMHEYFDGPNKETFKELEQKIKEES